MSIRVPNDHISDGFDVHVVFQEEQVDIADALFVAFQEFLKQEQVPHQRAILFSTPVGPWPTPMWQVLLRNPDPNALHRDLGTCAAWLMLNRGPLSVMVHANTKRLAEVGGEREDHTQNLFWMGPPLALKLDGFR